MLDSSCSETPKTKKKTAQNRPVQRFWPDSIASGAAQPPPGELAMSEGTGRPGRACGDTAGRGWPRARGAGRPSGPASSGRGSRCVPRPLLPLRREGGGSRARRSVPVRGAREGGTTAGPRQHAREARATPKARGRPAPRSPGLGPQGAPPLSPWPPPAGRSCSRGTRYFRSDPQDRQRALRPVLETTPQVPAERPRDSQGSRGEVRRVNSTPLGGRAW